MGSDKTAAGPQVIKASSSHTGNKVKILPPKLISIITLTNNKGKMSDKHAHFKRGEAQFITQISMATSLGSVHRSVCLIGAVSQTVKVQKQHKPRKRAEE